MQGYTNDYSSTLEPAIRLEDLSGRGFGGRVADLRPSVLLEVETSTSSSPPGPAQR